MNLRDLIESSVSIRIELVNATIKLRKFSLNDDLYAETMFPDGLPDLEGDLSTVELENLFRIAYSLILDKTPFKAVPYEDIDESGNLITRDIGGFELFKLLINGTEEQMAIITAVYQSVINARPKREEVEKTKSKTKKKI